MLISFLDRFTDKLMRLMRLDKVFRYVLALSILIELSSKLNERVERLESLFREDRRDYYDDDYPLISPI